jgi:hypothetical protein
MQIPATAEYYGGYTLVTLSRIVTPYRDSVDGTRARVTHQSWLRGNVTGFFGVLSVSTSHNTTNSSFRQSTTTVCDIGILL